MKLCSLRLFSLIFFCLSVCAWGKVVDKVAAVVNNDVILESDIKKFAQKASSKSFQELFGGIDEKALSNRSSVLDLLIDEKLLNQQVKKLELQATDVEIDGQIRAILKRNNISQDQLKERLKQLGTTFQEYREGIQRQIERKNLIDREIRPNLEVTEEQLKRFYSASNPSDSGQIYSIAHIFIDGKDAKAKARAEKVYDLVKNAPQEFEKAVKEYSDDTSSANNGGALGEFSSNSLSKEFKATVIKTPKGTVTKPLLTAQGYHIVKVTDVKSGDFSHLSKEKKDYIRNMFVASEVERRLSLWLERKRTEAHITKPATKS